MNEDNTKDLLVMHGRSTETKPGIFFHLSNALPMESVTPSPVISSVRDASISTFQAIRLISNVEQENLR